AQPLVSVWYHGVTPLPDPPEARQVTGRLQRRQYLRHVLFRIHLWPDLLDAPVRPDEKRHPVHAHVLAAPEGLLAPHTVIIGDLVALIRQQDERQLEFLYEIVVLPHRIRTHAQHHRATIAQRRKIVAKSARLRGATRRVVLGIEIQHHVPTAT